MGGFFGVASKEDCVFDLYFGTDYHSHLGTRRAGLAVYDAERGFEKAIHNIENAPFRTKFTTEFDSMKGTMGIGCISDFEAQPILVRSHHGSYAITTVGRINNAEEIVNEIVADKTHFLKCRTVTSIRPSLLPPLSIARTISLRVSSTRRKSLKALSAC